LARGKLAGEASWEHALRKAEHARDAYYTAARAYYDQLRGREIGRCQPEVDPPELTTSHARPERDG
jgi:hypothetical protein